MRFALVGSGVIAPTHVRALLELARVVQRYDGRNIEAARNDGGVRSQAAQVSEKCDKPVLFVLQHIGRT